MSYWFLTLLISPSLVIAPIAAVAAVSPFPDSQAGLVAKAASAPPGAHRTFLLGVICERLGQDGPDPEKLRSELAARGIPVTGVIDADVTLEDVFLSVVGKAEKKAPTAAKASKPS